MACAVIDVCGNEFDPKELLDLTGLEFVMYHRNSYQAYIEIENISEALAEVGRIINQAFEQFSMISGADDEAEIIVDLRNYLVVDSNILIPVELFKHFGLISLNVSQCNFLS